MSAFSIGGISPDYDPEGLSVSYSCDSSVIPAMSGGSFTRFWQHHPANVSINGEISVSGSYATRTFIEGVQGLIAGRVAQNVTGPGISGQYIVISAGGSPMKPMPVITNSNGTVLSSVTLYTYSITLTRVGY